MKGTYERIRRSIQNSGKFFFSVAMVLPALLFLLPVYIALVNAFKPYGEIIRQPLALPVVFTLDNFILAFQSANIGRLYANSLFITITSTALVIVVTSAASYILAKRKNTFFKYLYIFFLIGIMVPPQLIVIPSIKTLQFLGLLNTFQGLFLFYVGTYMSLGTFLYVEFIKTIPDSIEESGIMDGAGTGTIFFKLIFPLLKPCTATVIIFLGLWIWNDFLPPMYILGSNAGRTITTGIYNAIGSKTTSWNIVFACAVYASLPVFIIYLVMQKQFIKGLTAGSIKG